MSEFVSLSYIDPESTIICAMRDDGSVRVIETSSAKLWAQALAGDFGQITTYAAPAGPSDEDRLEVERAAMVASRFQIKAALFLTDRLKTADETMASADPITQLAWAENPRDVAHGR